jgi:hypothetical protein
MIEYYLIRHRKHGVNIARRVMFARFSYYYVWHDPDGKPHTAREHSDMLLHVEPITDVNGKGC